MISTAAVTVLVIRTAFPDLKLDEVTLGLLALAAVPWQGAVLKSMALPGGIQIEYRDLQRIEQAARDAGLMSTAGEGELESAYVEVAPRDPRLALAGLRIEIEARLRRAADALALNTHGRGLSSVLKELTSAGALDKEQSLLLQDLIALGNNAVHGAEISGDAATWAIDVGPQLIAALDEKFEEY